MFFLLFVPIGVRSQESEVKRFPNPTGRLHNSEDAMPEPFPA
jgi:hypothetical protein